MRNFTFKRQLLFVMFMLLGCLSIQAADDELITKQITIKLDKAGTLPDKVRSKKYNITNLKIIGEVNGTDWNAIREMAGSDYYGEKTNGNLSVLDLSEAKVVSGGDSYCYDEYYKNDIFRCGCYTSNDNIGRLAFYNCSNLTSLTLPSSVTGIKYSAFKGCTKLTSLALFSNLTYDCIIDTDGIRNSLKELRFYICDDLDTYLQKGHYEIYVKCGIKYYLNDKEIKDVVIPSNVTSLGRYAFQNSCLTSVTLPSSLASVGDGAFKNCSSLASVNFSSGLTSIGSYAFKNCSSLASINFPSSLTSIGGSAFSGCRGLASIILPSNLASIGEEVFAHCIGLTSINLPSGLTSIGKSAFFSCSGLTSLTFPSGLKLIDSRAFQDCTGLTSITLPSSLTYISSYTFSGCNRLLSINLPSGLRSIGGHAFAECRNLASLIIPSSVVEIGDYAFAECGNIASLTIPSGVAKIGDYAFSDCSYLTSLTIPSSVTKIGDYAFLKCSTLQSVYVSWPTPISAGSAFSGVGVSKCTLYVPQGTETDYFLADVWGYFGNIVEYDPTGIDKVTTSTDAKELSRYSVNGQRLSAPAKGLNIVKYSDGSVKKVVVQ